MKKKPDSQKTVGAPWSTQSWKNAKRSRTSRTYGPNGFRLGKDFFSHSAGTLPSKSARPTYSARKALHSANGAWHHVQHCDSFT